MKKLIAVLIMCLVAACTFTGNQVDVSTSTLNPTASATAASTVSPSPTSLPASPTPLPPTPTPASSPTSTLSPADLRWWDDAVFYEIFVRSFYDSNGDGIGDFNGLISKLDYLNDGNPQTTTDLGINAIWLMPIHPSPSTHGYDVTDYYAVNPQYGTMVDFRRLVAEAHLRGIRVIIDLVINHTSNQHPWFVQSQDAQSPFRNWYIWEDSDPGFTGPWGQTVWHELNGDYFYGYFWEGMPDLNYTNPEVTAEMEKVARFWLDDVGIDGFRLDAIGALIEKGTQTVETKETHAWLASYFSFYKQQKPDAMTIGEVWSPDAVVIPYVANHEVDLAFEFDLSTAMLASLNEGSATRIIDTLNSGTRRFPAGQYGTFLTNHDMARVMTQLDGSIEKAKTAAALYFSLPGVPFIYYGEEIGMLGDAPDEMGRRPMQWSGKANAGFTSAAPWKLSDASYPATNVAAEINDPGSLLSFYRTLISLRSSHPALRTGELSLLSSSNPCLFAFLRTSTEEAILVVVNLTDSPARDYRLSLATSSLAQGEYTSTLLLGEVPAAALIVIGQGGIEKYIPVPEIPPYAAIMMRLNGK